MDIVAFAGWLPMQLRGCRASDGFAVFRVGLEVLGCCCPRMSREAERLGEQVSGYLYNIQTMATEHGRDRPRQGGALHGLPRTICAPRVRANRDGLAVALGWRASATSMGARWGLLMSVVGSRKTAFSPAVAGRMSARQVRYFPAHRHRRTSPRRFAVMIVGLWWTLPRGNERPGQ